MERLMRVSKKPERNVHKCPSCGKDMTFYSSETYSEHYVCLGCNQFLDIPRPVNFYKKNPFKPKIY